jgi:exodeoxyribonuclease VII large subunit
MVDATLRDHLPRRLRVVGEVSGFNDRTHWYFSLKDAGAVVSCVMFASAARASGFRPENGQEVVAAGRVEFFAKQGRTQFYVEKLEPVGAGALDLQFKRLCDELRALGWFAPERKRPLPRTPRRICVITSRTSAAYQDVLDTMRRRAPGVAIALVDVRVQGDGAARQVADALRAAGREHAALAIDAILVTRGGGSKEDLWTFNERIVAEAIVASPIPVVAAIGHETDVTIAELVADERCATPTQAAMRLTPDAAELARQLESYAARLGHAAARHAQLQARRLAESSRHPFFSNPRVILDATRERATRDARAICSAMRARLHADASRLERAAGAIEKHRPATVFARREGDLERARLRLVAAMRARLAALAPDPLERALALVGPASVMRRGYSVTLRSDGSAVRSAADVHAGDSVRTLVADGSFESTVTSGPPRTKPASKRSSAGSPSPEGGLFGDTRPDRV